MTKNLLIIVLLLYGSQNLLAQSLALTTTSPKFQQTLNNEMGGAEPRFNGNISRMQWKTGNDNVQRGYDFYYDGLSRLTSSHYAEGSDMSQNKERYSENILSYSPNGSIEKLQRYGKRNNDTFGLIDDLTYSYNGNQVKSITDKAGSLLYDGSFDFKDGANEATEYFYDANGALTKDLNKGIDNIEYDVLGNLKCITFSNGNKTKYVYDADGTKLRTTHESVVTNTTDYAGNFVFEDGKLDKYLFEGGYCSFDANLQPTYHYYEKDHLGSVRMVVNENGTIEQVNHYYPFGGVYGDLSYNSELQRNKYIGKEFDHTDGLDWYDHGARMYDAARVAWDRKEPLYDKYYRLNPYLYSGNNPITFMDMDGKETHVVKNFNGTFSVIGGVLNKDRNIYVYLQDDDGKFTIKGTSIGKSTSTTSFYNSDTQKWAINSVLDPNDTSGKEFLNKITSLNVTLDDYISNARNDHPYDFKVTNGGLSVVAKDSKYVYRGMIIGGKDENLYSSARDIGNMAAGIVAAKNGLPWSVARCAFDAYQSRHGLQVEGISTRNAEYYGWSQMYNHSNGITEAKHIKQTLRSSIKKIFQILSNLF